MVAFDDLIPKLEGFLAKRVVNPADREDLSQDILLRIHQGAPKLADQTRIHGWIWQIARNAIVDYYRRNHRPVLDFEAAPPPDVHEIVIGWLVPMVDQLPEPYREAVRLSDLEGVPQAAIADRLSIRLSAAKSRIQSGRAKLRKSLTGCCELEFGPNGRIASFEPVAADRCPFC